jgi:hypothetical protein
MFHASPPRCSTAAAILLFTTVGVIAQAPAAEQTMNIVMEDQFRTKRETVTHQGAVVVLVYAERHGAEAALQLGRRLHLRFHPTADSASAEAWSKQPVVGLAGWPAGLPVPDVQVIPVASLTEVPRALQPVARARMRKDSPHVPVWLDFEGTLKQMFGIIPGEPNVVVLDTAGRVHSVLSGKLDEQEYEQFVGLIDQLRLAAHPTLRVAEQPGGNITR